MKESVIVKLDKNIFLLIISNFFLMISNFFEFLKNISIFLPLIIILKLSKINSSG